MPCTPCEVLRQLGMNLAELTDKALNTLLLGDPNENLSRRIARARQAGQRWAVLACRLLTGLFWVFNHGDHCTLSLEAGSRATEVWHWSGAEVPPQDSPEPTAP